MSNISTIDVKPVRATLNRPTIQTGPKPQITVRARLVSYPQKKQRAKARRIEGVLSQILVFGFLTLTSYGISSIAGQVMVEQSRREASNAKTITLSALRTESDLKSHLLELTNPESIAKWAAEHQFTIDGVNPKPATPASGLLALRD